MTQFKRFILASITLFLLFVFNSCQLANEVAELSEEEIAEIVEAALQSSAGGLTTNLQDMAEQLVNAVASGEICDSTYTETIEKSNPGPPVASSYTSDLTYSMTCNNLGIPQTATFSSISETLYSAPRLESDDDAVFTGDVSGLQPSSSEIMLEGDYDRTGLQEANFTQTYTITSSLTIDFTGVSIEKQDNEITAGNGTFTISGSTQSSTFSHSGSITFNGDGTATLVLNGESYVINLD